MYIPARFSPPDQQIEKVARPCSRCSSAAHPGPEQLVKVKGLDCALGKCPVLVGVAAPSEWIGTEDNPVRPVRPTAMARACAIQSATTGDSGDTLRTGIDPHVLERRSARIHVPALLTGVPGNRRPPSATYGSRAATTSSEERRGQGGKRIELRCVETVLSPPPKLFQGFDTGNSGGLVTFRFAYCCTKR
jgi:hypothetical protein